MSSQVSSARPVRQPSSRDSIVVEVRNHMGHLTLNRPEGLNAIDLDMVRTLRQQLDLWADDPSVHAVVLRGAGSKAFCAGGDIRSLYESHQNGQDLHYTFFAEEYELDLTIHRYRKPILALMDGTTEMFEFREGGRPAAAVERGLIITGDQVTDAKASFDEHGRPQVNINLDGHGGELMSRATRSNVGRSMAVIFIEQRPTTTYTKQMVNGVEKDVPVQTFKEEKKIISLATIQSPLGSQFRITGLNGQGESSELALLLRAGGLAAPMYFAEERTIGPSLGADNITKGIDASLWGMLFVSLFIMAIYRFFGLIATVALALNMVMLLALMSLLGATLTLPGIAGIVLTMGMAVDANVLIFSRIREEIANGMTVQRAINEGFDRAYTAILDANLTTLLVGGILFAMGTGPVKGFAVTMSLGIFTSMFTAIMVTRAMVNLIYGGRDFKKLWI